MQGLGLNQINLRPELEIFSTNHTALQLINSSEISQPCDLQKKTTKSNLWLCFYSASLFLLFLLFFFLLCSDIVHIQYTLPLLEPLCGLKFPASSIKKLITIINKETYWATINHTKKLFFFFFFATAPSPLMGIKKKLGYESLRTPFIGFSSKKEMGTKSVLGFSETVRMGLVTPPVEENLTCQVRDAY